MKKLIFLQLGIFIFLFNLAQASAINIYGQNGEAEKIFQEIQQLKEDLGGYESDCDNIWARIEIRMVMLPDQYILGFINDESRNACLRSDLDNLEKALSQVAELAPKTKVACGEIEGLTRKLNGKDYNVNIYYVKDKISDLRTRIECLRKYGADAESKKDEECQDRTYYNSMYANDDQCPAPQNQKLFSELKKSGNELIEKWNILKNNYTNWQTTFNTDINYKTIKEKASARADSWLKKNLSIKYEGSNFSFGIGYLTQSDKEKLKLQGITWSNLLPTLGDWPTVGVTSSIFGQIETIYQDQQFAENFAELIMEKEIFENINLDIATGLEAPLNCYQFSCNITKSSSGISAASTPANCTYPIKKLPDQTLTDGLKEKTDSLKDLLDSHNKK